MTQETSHIIVEITRGVATSGGANMMLVRNEDWSYYIVCAMPNVLSNFMGERNVIYVEADVRGDKGVTCSEKSGRRYSRSLRSSTS